MKKFLRKRWLVLALVAAVILSISTTTVLASPQGNPFQELWDKVFNLEDRIVVLEETEPELPEPVNYRAGSGEIPFYTVDILFDTSLTDAQYSVCVTEVSSTGVFLGVYDKTKDGFTVGYNRSAYTVTFDWIAIPYK